MVDDFDVHLEAALVKKNKVTTDWEGKFHIGIVLKWDYEIVTVQVSMPSYVRAALHAFQHEKKNDRRTHHTNGHNPLTEITINFYQKNHQLSNWMNITRKDFIK